MSSKKSPGEFVATKDWQPTHGASVPGGLDVRLPLDGRAAAAKLPDEWRLQLYIEEQKAFFRADVKPSDTVAEIEAALGLWATVPAVLSCTAAARRSTPKRPRRASGCSNSGATSS